MQVNNASERTSGHRLAMKTMATNEAIAVMLQKTCMAEKQ
jgi:hypothetical protein